MERNEVREIVSEFKTNSLVLWDFRKGNLLGPEIPNIQPLLYRSLGMNNYDIKEKI